jgi:hypothetical protein
VLGFFETLILVIGKVSFIERWLGILGSEGVC